jgi:hypothetical protein
LLSFPIGHDVLPWDPARPTPARGPSRLVIQLFEIVSIPK